MIFENGDKLKSVMGPTSKEGQVYYNILDSSPDYCRAISIIIEMQYGQMGTVPWARVEKENGSIIMINLALMEAVEPLETT